MTRPDATSLPGRLLRITPVLLATFLSACAALDESECRTADWQLIGYEDGAAGRPGTRIGEYREACADHGVSPNLAAYREGRETGLREYCLPQNGYRLGNGGKGYGGVCPADLDGDFRAAYDAGRRVYVARSRVKATRSKIRTKQSDLDKLKKGYASLASELISNSTTQERRAELLVETAQMVEKQGQLQAQLGELKARLARQRKALADLENLGQAWHTGQKLSQRL
jgi:hypothetical protein